MYFDDSVESTVDGSTRLAARLAGPLR